MRNRIQFKCDWKRRLFSTNYEVLSEMVVTDNRKDNIAAIPDRTSFKTDQILSDDVSGFFDDNFWGAYNIIEPSESLEQAVDKPKKKYKNL